MFRMPWIFRTAGGGGAPSGAPSGKGPDRAAGDGSLWRSLAGLGLAVLVVVGLQVASQLPLAISHDLPVPAVPGDMPGDVVLGSPVAPQSVVALLSATCVHCRAWVADTLPGIEAGLLATGQVRLVIRQYPLDGQALAAAAFLSCLPAEFRADAMRRLWSAPLPSWSGGGYDMLAAAGFSRDAGGDAAVACAASGATRQAVAASADAARREWDVRATPTFVAGRHVQPGEQSLAGLEEMLAH